MDYHRILFITCMTLESPRSASMAYMGVLLEEFPGPFVWYALRPATAGDTNPYNIPYAMDRPLEQPARLPTLRHFLKFLPYATLQGRRAAQFGRKHDVERVWADLSFEAVVAGRVAAQVLGVPLIVSIHDDPVNRIRVKNFPAWLVGLYERQFARTLRTAQVVGVISDYMGGVYSKRYGVETITLYPGVQARECLPQKPLKETQIPILIGSVGSINAPDAWDTLVCAVRLLNQRAGVEKFRILHLGAWPVHFSSPPSEVEVTDWLPESEFVRHMARFDLSFLGSSFQPQDAETGRMSFPLKITSYLRAQAPMLSVAPADSSVARFVREQDCGVFCNTPEPAKLAEILSSFVQDASALACSRQNLARLSRVFSRQAFFEKFGMFVQCKR